MPSKICMEIPRFNRGVSGNKVADALRSAGCAVIECLASEELIERVSEEMEPFIKATAFGPDSFTGSNTRRTGSLIARSLSSHALAAHPIVVEAATSILCEKATSMQLHLTQVIDLGSGAEAQTVHRDQWAWDFFPFAEGWEVEVSTMWALTDFTERNGATRIIPGSHKWDDRLKLSYDETIPAEMPRGSILLWLGSTYHGGGRNETDTRRTGLNFDYSASFLRQEENQYLACPPEVAATLNPDLAKLIGYTRGSYALGYYGDLQDPMEALKIDK
ncbi:MAG TPA: phytanoyl-CoA dioxygenase family protein [Candidatus Thalassarchaeaceae archaeon]|nr:phytanoyl-CoA dioxygenase family protein [Candidatus Thalassarchaeaceae archaeon]HJM97803.1 phytanoyl-CoA dioxygenase family protein [Acidimicrobiales bacterium]